MKPQPPPPAPWRKSSYSESCDCVEAAAFGGQIGIRDSKNPAAGHLTLTREGFTALLTRLAAQQ